jgi:hypothetical protein
LETQWSTSADGANDVALTAVGDPANKPSTSAVVAMMEAILFISLLFLGSFADWLLVLIWMMSL